MKLHRAYDRIRIFGLDHEHNYRKKLGVTTEFYNFSGSSQFKNFADGKYYQPEITSPETGERIGNKRVNKCYPGFKANPQTLVCEPQRDKSAPEPRDSIVLPEPLFKKTRGISVTPTEEDIPDSTIKRIDITNWEAVNTPAARKSMFDRILDLEDKDQLKAALEVTSTLEEAKEYIKARQREADSPNERSIKIKNDFAYQGKNLKWYANDRGSDISPQHLAVVQKLWGGKNFFPDDIYFVTKDRFVIEKLNGSLIYRGVMDADGFPKYRDEQNVLRSDDQYNICPANKQKTKETISMIEACKTKVTQKEASENMENPLPDSPNHVDPITRTPEYIKAREKESEAIYPERIQIKKEIYAEKLRSLPEKQRPDEIRKIRLNDKGFNITYYHYNELTSYFGATSFKQGEFVFKTKDNKFIKYSSNSEGEKTFQYISQPPEDVNVRGAVKSSDLKPIDQLKEVIDTNTSRVSVIEKYFPPTEQESKLEVFKYARQNGLNAFSEIAEIKDTDSLIDFIKDMKSQGIRILRRIDKNGALNYKFYYPITTNDLSRLSNGLDQSDLFQLLKERELNRYSEYSLVSNKEANDQFEAAYIKVRELLESEDSLVKKQELKKLVDYFLSLVTRGSSSKLTDLLVVGDPAGYNLPSGKNIQGAYVSNSKELLDKVAYLDRLKDFAAKQSYGDLLKAVSDLEVSIKSESQWDKLSLEWGKLFNTLERVGLEGSIPNLAEIAALQFLLKTGKESNIFVPKDTNFPVYDLLTGSKLYPVKYKKGVPAGTTAFNKLYQEEYISTIQIDPKNFVTMIDMGTDKESAKTLLRNIASDFSSTGGETKYGIDINKLKQNNNPISIEFNRLIDENNIDNLFEVLLQTGYIKFNKNNEYRMISPRFLGHAIFAIASINEQQNKNPTQINVDINKDNFLEIKETPVTMNNLRFRLRTDRSKGLRYTIEEPREFEDLAEKLVEQAEFVEDSEELLQRADNLIKSV